MTGVFSTILHREQGLRLPLSWTSSSSSSNSNPDTNPSTTATAITTSASSYSVLHRELHKSQYFVEKLSLHSQLRPSHSGCVNSVLFSDNGDFLYTGSDDTHVHIHDSYSLKLLLDFPTQHSNNVFFAKELAATNCYYEGNGDAFCNVNNENDNENHPDNAISNTSSDLDWMITCAADGRVILHHLPTNRHQLIHRHQGRAHRIGLPTAGNQDGKRFFSCGEDGHCCLFDIRDHQKRQWFPTTPSLDLEQSTLRHQQTLTPEMTITLKNSKKQTISIFSIALNPWNYNELALSGECGAVNLYDIRNPTVPFGYLYPEHLGSVYNSSHITGIKYTADGKMIVASYNDEQIYSFNVLDHQRNEPFTECNTSDRDREGLDDEDEDDDDELCDNNNLENLNTVPEVEPLPSSQVSRGFYQKYCGHLNSDTVKQVGVFGSRSEYVVSGSDCGHIFLWNIHTTKLVKVLKGDRVGAVNCLSAHPIIPMLATSGLEDNAKIWMPIGNRIPLLEGSKQWDKVERLKESNATGNRSSFREREMNGAVFRRMLLMLTSGIDEEMSETIESSDSNEEDADATLNNSMRRPREEIGEQEEEEEVDSPRRPTRRHRQNNPVELFDYASIIPLIRAVLNHHREDDDDRMGSMDSDIDSDSSGNEGDDNNSDDIALEEG